ncbi:MAG: hypothetical protein AAFQ94_25600 [Bacteroidota bacterium]
MKNFIIIILLTYITFGCTSYAPGDLNGKWAHPSEPRELWINDTLALGFDIENQLMNTYSIEYDQQMLTFTFIDHMKGSTPCQMKVINLSDTELKTESQHPDSNKGQITIYQRTSQESLEIFTDDAINWERYKEYMMSKLESQ